MVFIEVKPVGQSFAGERQLFEYAFHKGVPMAILTDGSEWHFFLPAEQGDYWERRVYKLDLVKRDIGEIVSRLERYLKYEAVCSGAAVEAARADYTEVRRERLVKTTLPQAWLNLVEDKDELLLELVADRVKILCKYKPSLATVADFLARLVVHVGEIPPLPPEPVPKPGEPQPPPPVSKNIGFILDGRFYTARNAREVLVQVFTKLADRDPGFLDSFAGLHRHGTQRRYLAHWPQEIYPRRPDLARDHSHSHELRPGWWLLVHWNKKGIEKVVKMACEVARLGYGTDLIINLGD